MDRRAGVPFHHVLIRDAAYRRLLKESRAELHERVAGWLQEKTADVLGEHDELVGYHLEQAHEYKRQLGRPDEQLGGRAASLLGAAAQRALDRDDLPAAAALSGRALDRLSADVSDARAELLLVRCESLLSMGAVSQGAGALDAFESLASSPRMRAWATCFAGHLANLTAPERWETTERDVAAAASELLALGDEAGAAKAHTVHAQALAKRGRFAECEAVLDDALTAARAANDRRRITATLGFLPHAVLWGPLTVSRAGGRCLDIVRLLRITTGSPAVEATSLRCQAVLEAFRGRTDAARRMLRSARRTLNELGLQHELLDTEQFAGIVELVGGDPAAASLHLHEAFDGYKRAGVDVLAAQSAALLARAHLLLGEVDQAATLVETSERSASGDLKAMVYGLAARAELLARRGEFASAREAAEEAVELASRTDALFDHGNALRSLAAVLRAAGDPAGAQGAEDRALALFERKGATALLTRPGVAADRAELVGSESNRRSTTSISRNRCASVSAEFYACLSGGDLEGALAFHPADRSLEDRRSGSKITLDATELRANYELMCAARPHIESRVLSTRGEFLALLLVDWSALGPGGYEAQTADMSEIDDNGLLVSRVAFDPGDLDAAMAEMDERFARGEGALAAECIELNARLLRAINTSDGREFRSVLADDIAITDHRPASLGTISADEWINSLRVGTELARRSAVAVSYPRVGKDAAVFDLRVAGLTDDGVEIESAMYVVVCSRAGKLTRFEMFPSDELQQTLERFDVLVSSQTLDNPANIPLNRAAQEQVRAFEAVNRGDAEGSLARYVDDCVREDRRSGLRTTVVGKDANIREVALVAVDGNQVSGELLATRGDRLALITTKWRIRRSGYVVEYLLAAECDDAGLMTAVVTFDRDDVDAAFAELDDRFAAGEGAIAAECVTLLGRFFRAVNAVDRDGMRAVLSADLALTDHRPVSLGSSTERDDWIASIVVLASELSISFSAAPVSYLRLGAEIALSDIRVSGRSKDGAEFDSAMYILARAEGGTLKQMELFGPEQLDAALARFDELEREPAPLENLATRTARVMQEAFVRRDWDAFRSGLRDDAVTEDLRSGVRVVVQGADARIEEAMSGAAIGAIAIDTEILAIRGERLCLEQLTFSGAGDDPYTVDYLSILEVDADGRIAATVRTDTQNVDLAFEELDERYIAGEGRPYEDVIRASRRTSEAFNRRDWAAAREAYAGSVVVVDHRPTSLGRLEGPDRVVDVVRERAELIPDQTRRHVVYHAIDTDRYVVQMSVTGTSTEGVYTESDHITVGSVRDGLIATWDIYPPYALDDALARFEELGQKRVPVIENEATRTLRAAHDCLVRGEWDAFAEFLAAATRNEDRRRGLGNVAGKDDVVEMAKVMLELGADRYELVPLAVRGERLALVRHTHKSSREAAHSVELLKVVELDTEGRISLVVNFDPDDFDAAYDALAERSFAHLDPKHRRVVEVSSRTRVAQNARDWDAYASALTDDFVLVDHRPASLGELDASGIVAAQTSLLEVIPDLSIYNAAGYAMEDYGGLALIVGIGHNADGGRVDLRYLTMNVLDGDRIARIEIYAVDALDEALARFRELRPADLPPPIDNAAMRAIEATLVHLTRGDWDAYEAVYSPDVRWEDRRPLFQSTAGIDAIVEGGRQVLALGGDRYEFVPIAVRGEKLALGRAVHGSTRPDSYETVVLKVAEVDDTGRITAMVNFDPDDLEAAITELDDRYAASREPARNLRLGTAMRRGVNRQDWTAVRATLTDDVVIVDHRPVSLGVMHGPDAWVRTIEGLAEVIPELFSYTSVVHGAASEVMFVQTEAHGMSVDGAEVDVPLVVVQVYRGEQVCRMELFPPEQFAAAKTRFDELVRARASSRIENECTRVMARAAETIRSGDSESVQAIFSAGYTLDDRRPGLRHDSSGVRGGAAYAQSFLGMGTLAASVDLAVRGERLCLHRYTLVDESQNEIDFIELTEIDHDGRVSAQVVFDAADLGAAHVELDARYVAGEGAAYADVVGVWSAETSAINERRWADLRAMLADDLVVRDHRPASFGELSALEWWSSVQVLPDIAPTYRTMTTRYHALASDRCWAQISASGVNADGGEVRFSMQTVTRVRGGKMVMLDIFSDDQNDEAQALFESLGPHPDALPLENAATQQNELARRILDEAAWEDAHLFIADDVELDDRRHGVRSVGRGRDAWIANFKAVHELGLTNGEGHVIAIRGDRLALNDGWMEDADGNQLAALQLNEIDASGRSSRIVWFDPDDRDAAFAELDERYIAGEGAPHERVIRSQRSIQEGWNRRDWALMGSAFAEDLVFVDHRPASLGEISGRDEAIRWAAAGITPDVRHDIVAYRAFGANGAAYEMVARGTNAEGGVVEQSYLHVFVLDPEGRTRRTERFDVDDLDAALARFEELKERAGPRENAASRAMKLVDRNLISGNPEASRSLYAEDVELYDVRAGVRLTLRGVDARIEDMRSAVDIGVRQVETTVVATRGDRLSLHRLVFAGAGPEPYDIEFLSIAELDADGLIRSSYRFDGSNLDGAFELLDERYVDSEGAEFADTVRRASARFDAHRRRDWDAWRDGYADDYIVVDHRPAGWGTIRGADAWMTHSIAAIEMAPDVRLYLAAIYGARAGAAFGEFLMTATNSEGGPVEIRYLFVARSRDGKLVRTENFPLERFEDAQARFEELGAEPVDVVRTDAQPRTNRAADVLREQLRIGPVGDWSTYAALLSEDVVLEDRRRGLGLRIAGRDALIEFTQASYPGVDLICVVLAVRGERLCLARDYVTMRQGFEVDLLVLNELDEDGRVAVVVLFDADDLAAAFAELDERYITGEGAPYAQILRVGDEQRTALRTGNWDVYRAVTDPDIVLVDHRPASLGEVRGLDAVINVLQNLGELMRNMKPRLRAYLALADDRTLADVIATATAEHGGEVEMTHLRLQQYRNGLVVRAETFPIDALDAALARFDELGAESSTSLTQDARSRLSGWVDAYLRQDLDAMRAMYAEGFVREDRRRSVQLVGDAEQYIDSMREMWNVGFTHLTTSLLATRGEHLTLSAAKFSDGLGNELEILSVVETDEFGLRVWSANFDADDVDAAYEALDERFIGGEGAR